jgi:hypothetical protein
MGRIKTYTHTEEGKYVLRILENVISTSGMEVYKCDHCEELFGSTPELAKYNNYPTCGICQNILKRENRDAFGLENLDEDYEECEVCDGTGLIWVEDLETQQECSYCEFGKKINEEE